MLLPLLSTDRHTAMDSVSLLSSAKHAASYTEHLERELITAIQKADSVTKRYIDLLEQSARVFVILDGYNTIKNALEFACTREFIRFNAVCMVDIPTVIEDSWMRVFRNIPELNVCFAPNLASTSTYNYQIIIMKYSNNITFANLARLEGQTIIFVKMDNDGSSIHFPHRPVTYNKMGEYELQTTFAGDVPPPCISPASMDQIKQKLLRLLV